MAQNAPPVSSIPSQYKRNSYTVNRASSLASSYNVEALGRPRSQSQSHAEANPYMPSRPRRQSVRFSATSDDIEKSTKRESYSTTNEKRRSNRISTVSTTSGRQDWSQSEQPQEPAPGQEWIDDEENPRNWSLSRKMVQTMIYSMCLVPVLFWLPQAYSPLANITLTWYAPTLDISRYLN